MSLSALLRAADAIREPDDAVGLMLVTVAGVHRVRVVVGGEVVAASAAPTRDEAVALALEAIDDTVCIEAFAEACT